jgi:hypothetical protein
MRLQEDRRGLAFGIFDIMILGLGTFALVFGLLYIPMSELFGMTGGLSGDAATGASYAQDAFVYLPFFAMVAAVFALIARSVAERRLV